MTTEGNLENIGYQRCIETKLADRLPPKKNSSNLNNGRSRIERLDDETGRLSASKKYPVLMYQYSGPGSQQVLDNFNVSWETYGQFGLHHRLC